MTNIAEWIERAREFVTSLESLPGEVFIRADIAPPLNNHQADELAKRLPKGLANVLRAFLTQGSSKCDCHYWWEPPERQWPKLQEIFPDKNFIYGGPVFCGASNMVDLQESCLDWAECFGGNTAQSQMDHELWLRCIPFAGIMNGDVLALDATTDAPDPAVVYLSHDGGSSIISASFTEFLRHWEAISYIGPEIWLLSYWKSEDTGHIDSAHPKTKLLYDLLMQR